MISVNIIANEAHDTFPAVLTSLIMQDSISALVKEVIILDNGKIPTESATISHLITLISRITNVAIVRSPDTPGVATARQELLDKSSGDMILSLDDDIIFKNHSGLFWLYNSLAEMRVGYAIANIDEVIPYRGSTPFSKPEVNFRESNRIQREIFVPDYVHGGCVLYSKECIDGIGGYKRLVDSATDKQAGEDVWVQTLLQEKFGGVAVKNAEAMHLIPAKNIRFGKDSIAGTAVKAGDGIVGEVLSGLSIAELAKRFFK